MDWFCDIALFGGPRLVVAGETISRFPTHKAGILLAYLALHPALHPRERLLDLLWPDLDLPAGRDNLSTTLSSLRRMIEPAGVRRGSVLLTSHQQVGLNPAAFRLDVRRFESLLADAARADLAAEKVSWLDSAISLSEADFLPGCYDDWAVREADRLAGLRAEALRHWSEVLEHSGEDESALRAAQQWLAVDPFCEPAHLRVIALHVRLGRTEAARAAQRAQERLWKEELGEPLSSQTRLAQEALFARPPLRRETLPYAGAGPHETGGPGVRRSARIKSSYAVAPSPLAEGPRGLSEPLDRFFGRESDMARLAQVLLPGKGADPVGDFAPAPSRLVTLVGPGGIGKTRLATEFASHVMRRSAVSCYFVPLAEETDPCRILPTIAASLRLPPSSSPPWERIAAFFADQDKPGMPQQLLILDNLEQLLSDPEKSEGQTRREEQTAGSAAEVVAELLRAIPALTCLCTSRCPLGLRGETLIEVAPLPLPKETGTGIAGETELAELALVPSVQLYLDRARAVRADFGLTRGNAAVVSALCRALEGSPLVLELAASWIRALPPQKMWERLAQDGGPGNLKGRYTDLAPRHRSLRATLDWSWRLLHPPEQRLLASLSLFRGGWTWEAAEEVSGEPAALDLLACLEEASLIWGTEDENGGMRWHCLETVRQYAADRLNESGAVSQYQGRHLRFFETLAGRATAELTAPEQGRWLDALTVENGNFRAALEFCRTNPAALGQGLRLAALLLPFWRARSHLQEGQEHCVALLSHPASAARVRARAAALCSLGTLAMLQSDYRLADASHEEALGICQELDDPAGEASALLGLGSTAFFRQDYPQARVFCERSLARREHIGDEDGLSAVLHTLGNVALREGQYGEAQASYERALAIRRKRGDRLGAAGTLGALGQLVFAQGDNTAAACFTLEALHLFDRAGQRWTGALCLEVLSRIAHCQERLDREVCLLGAATALRNRYNFLVPPAERGAQETRVTVLRGQIGIAAFESAWASGCAFSWEQAIQYAGDEPA